MALVYVCSDVWGRREEWLRDYCAQIALVASQIIWTDEVSRCFEELEGGSENAMKDYKRVYDDRIEKLIRQVQQDLSSDLRVKIITLITIDVHARDVVESFIAKRLTEGIAIFTLSLCAFLREEISESLSFLEIRCRLDFVGLPPGP